MLLVSGERDVPLSERTVLFVVCSHASLGASWDWEGAEGMGWSSMDAGTWGWGRESLCWSSHLDSSCETLRLQ